MIEAALVALATDQPKPNRKKESLMSMNMPNQEMNQSAQLQKTPLTFNVYDPATGRTWNEDNAGRRITPRRDMTGSQLVAIQSMRSQLGLPMLNNHNVNQMSIDSASRMQDDLRFFIEQYRFIADEKMRIDKQHEEQIAVLMEQLDECLKDPKVAAELAKQRQHENVQREMKDK
jgi:hypothetical protein